MKKSESEANSSIRAAAEKARAETLERQAKTRAEFLAGDGIVIRRYNKEAVKQRRQYLRNNGRQLEEARKIRKAKAAAARREAKATRVVPGRKKKTFIIGAEEKAKADKKWATNKARYILHRIGNKHVRAEALQHNAEAKEQS